jgi:hypothetical protein
MHDNRDAHSARPRGDHPVLRLYVAVGWAAHGGLYDIVALGTVRAADRTAALAAARLRWPARAALGGGALRVRPASVCRRSYLPAALAADAHPTGLA